MSLSLAPSLQADVVVCGGGVAGTMAAVAAARKGASVLLLERYGFLGGNATAGAVAQFNSWQTAAGRPVVAGLAEELVQHLRAKGGAREHQTFTMSNGHVMDRVEYSPEILKLVLDEMVLQAGVQPLLHTTLLDVSAGQGRVHSLRIHARSQTRDLHPQVLIDATGDVEALRLAGASFLSLKEGEALQPATMMFRFGPIDWSAWSALPAPELQRLAALGFSQGRLARAALHASRDPFSDDAWFNISRLAVDAVDPLALGAAEMQGRQQAWAAAQFIREAVPGCAQGQLRAFATQVGVRESRRMHGDHVLSAEELLAPVRFEDAIAAGAYPIDIHPGSGAGLDYRALPADHAYQIPLRSLIPQGLDNVLAVGRGVSATHQALAAIRVMTISMAVGQAAGTAAALAIRQAAGKPVAVRDVRVAEVQAALLRDGAILG